MRFNTIFQLAFVFALLMMEVACVPKTPVTLLAKPRAELDLASRAGGCPEGMPCKRQKPRISDQYLAQDIGDSSSKDLLAEDEELRLWQRMHDDSATTRGMLDLYRPKPAEAKAKPKIVRPKHPGPTPVASTLVDTQSADISLDVRINFSVDSAVLTPEGQKQADELGKLLQQKLQGSDQIAVLVGHTDMLGSEEYNDHLSEERANTVKTYLISKFPDLKGKLTGRGMGKRQPIFKEMDEESQSLNRRVEVKLSRSTE